MIDRRAFWISILLVVAMIVANIWRLSLLPDWHYVPIEGPGGNGHVIYVWWTFVPPLGVLFLIGLLLVRSRLRSGPEEAMQPWRLYHGVTLLFAAGVMALAQAFNIARSLGALRSIDRLTLSHVIFAAGGLFMMVAGNSLPKMPWLTARFRPLDPWQWNQHLRFAGRLTVAFGLFFAVGMPLLPVKAALPVSLGLMLTMIAAGSWHRAKLRRQPSPES